MAEYSSCIACGHTDSESVATCERCGDKMMIVPDESVHPEELPVISSTKCVHHNFDEMYKSYKDNGDNPPFLQVQTDQHKERSPLSFQVEEVAAVLDVED